MPDTSRERKRWKEVYDDANEWRLHWKEIAEYFMPRRGRFLNNETQEDNEGERGLDTKVINTAPYRALDVAAAGLMSGLTSPSRPWFRLGLDDKELMEFTPVRAWLETVRDRMLSVFQRSNFYGAMHNLYREVLVFGYNPMIIDEDLRTVIRCKPMTIGEAYITLDSTYRPDGMYRQFWMTADQVVEKFGDGKENMNVPEQIRTAVANKKASTKFLIGHALEPTQRVDAKYRINGSQFMSTYYWLGEPEKSEYAALAQFGHRSKPFVAPRWDVVGTDTYGDCPGIKALSDNKQLQAMEVDKLKALDKMVDPPMNAPTSMRSTGGSLLPGDINYIDTQQGQQGFAPTYQVRPEIEQLAFELDRIERRIDTHFFKDLFLAILNESKQMTAHEVAARHTEKLQVLGPALERLQSEALDVIVDRTFAVMDGFGLIPVPPDEIQGMDYKVEYISVLAQAQKMVGLTAIEQVAGFVGSLAGVQPDVVDKFDGDQAVDEYGEQVGVPAGIIRSDDEVEQIRAARAQAQAQQAKMDQIGEMAQGAKVLSEAKVGGNNVLSQLVGGVTGE